MMDPRRAVFNRVALSALALSAPLLAQGPDEGMIRAARTRYNQAIARHDTVAISSAWLPEYTSVNSLNVHVMGLDSTRANYLRMFANRPDVVYVRMPERIDVNTSWGHAAETGSWTGRWTQSDSVTHVGGRYFAKWRKVSGHWMLLTEVFVQMTCSGSSYCLPR